ncbi:unnamed protein product [Phytophthora fragariaefolia]|uniref:Unnamed protein product n=1 Tax=Phytophthora fragariaefolia TaxID=1490495 RepID=A0A9W7CSC1_9STRA|nr:unnamed protein product [Phytophthora fragariaefolia]
MESSPSSSYSAISATLCFRLEMSLAVKQIFEACVQTQLYPRSQIDVFVQVLHADGGELPASINAITLALIDAGIALNDFVVASSAGYLQQTMLCGEAARGVCGEGLVAHIVIVIVIGIVIGIGIGIGIGGAAGRPELRRGAGARAADGDRAEPAHAEAQPAADGVQAAARAVRGPHGGGHRRLQPDLRPAAERRAREHVEAAAAARLGRRLERGWRTAAHASRDSATRPQEVETARPATAADEALNPRAAREPPQGQESENLAWMDMMLALLEKRYGAGAALPVCLTELEAANLLQLPQRKKLKTSASRTSLDASRTHSSGRTPAHGSSDLQQSSARSEREQELAKDDKRQRLLLRHAQQIQASSVASSTSCGCKTGCLKMYCMCFSSRGFCHAGCACDDCKNGRKNQTERVEAIHNYLANDPRAFSFASLPQNASTTGFLHLLPQRIPSGGCRQPWFCCGIPRRADHRRLNAGRVKRSTRRLPRQQPVAAAPATQEAQAHVPRPEGQTPVAGKFGRCTDGFLMQERAEALRDEVARLEAQVSVLETKGMSARELAAVGLLHVQAETKMLGDVVRNQQLGVAAAQSLTMEHTVRIVGALAFM